MSTVGKRIHDRRVALGITADELALRLGKNRATVYRYENNEIENLPISVIGPLAAALRVTPAYLMGWTEAEETLPVERGELPEGVLPLPEMQKLPLVGRIACGTPVLAEENIEDYVDVPRHLRADYALVCRGDSMIGAGIHDGDLVYIRRQEEVHNGQIAAILVDGDEATLKRFYFDGTAVTLVAENPSVPPRVFAGEEINRQKVIGLAVAFIHAIE